MPDSGGDKRHMPGAPDLAVFGGQVPQHPRSVGQETSNPFQLRGRPTSARATVPAETGADLSCVSGRELLCRLSQALGQAPPPFGSCYGTRDVPLDVTMEVDCPVWGRASEAGAAGR